ncbi:MAG: hypothetical protein JXA78_13780 [Anaerolineales bacterium]|nr:hypothetical protein [Anaerolineales bacterium]
MKKTAFFILLALAASTLMAAMPVQVNSPGGDGQADATLALLEKEPGMCYDPLFKVWYPCVGRGLENKYPWLSEQELQKKAVQLWEDANPGWFSACKRVWDILPGGIVIYSCKWKNDLPTYYYHLKYYY